MLEIIWVNAGSMVEQNGGVDSHPFHAHGGHYYDIGSGNGTYNHEENEKKFANYNPVVRDTTNLYRYTEYTTPRINAGWRGWRLRVESPGVWMIHFHILQHTVRGMERVWMMRDGEQIARLSRPVAGGYLGVWGECVWEWDVGAGGCATV